VTARLLRDLSLIAVAFLASALVSVLTGAVIGFGVFGLVNWLSGMLP